jgi:hypothetical protein
LPNVLNHGYRGMKRAHPEGPAANACGRPRAPFVWAVTLSGTRVLRRLLENEVDERLRPYAVVRHDDQLVVVDDDDMAVLRRMQVAFRGTLYLLSADTRSGYDHRLLYPMVITGRVVIHLYHLMTRVLRKVILTYIHGNKKAEGCPSAFSCPTVRLKNA